MLTNCIHRYVILIARLKGIYTYYEEEKKKVYKYHTLWTWKSTACVCYEQTLDIVVWLCILIWRGWDESYTFVIHRFIYRHIIRCSSDLFIKLFFSKCTFIQWFCNVYILFIKKKYFSLCRKWVVKLDSKTIRRSLTYLTTLRSICFSNYTLIMMPSSDLISHIFPFPSQCHFVYVVLL